MFRDWGIELLDVQGLGLRDLSCGEQVKRV